MHTLPPPDEMARRLERRTGEDYADGLQAEIDAGRAPEAEIRRWGETIAIKRPGWPGNQVFCFGVGDLGHLPAILDFFGGGAPQFYLSSNGFAPQVGQALAAAGFYQDGFEQALTYGLPLAESAEPPAGIAIEPVDEANAEVFLDVMAEGFGWDPAWREGAKAGERGNLGRPGYHAFLACCDGEPAATGVLKIKDGMGNLVGGATAPAQRRKGCQLALLQRRLYEAGRLGCAVAVSGGAYGSSSLRNQHRAGLRIAYIESGWKKGPA